MDKKTEALTEQPAPPPECQTEAEKTAYAFGWFKALELVRKRPAEQEPMTTQTEADRLANQLDYHREYDLGVTHTGIDEQAAAELRRQQAEIERLNEALAEQPAPMIHGDIRDGLVDDEPAQQELGRNHWEDGDVFERIGAMKKQPAQQEPVAWMFQHEETGRTMCVDAQQVEWGFEKGNPRLKKIAPLYEHPPQRTWVGLTDDEISILSASMGFDPCVKGVIRDAEAKLKEKNT